MHRSNKYDAPREMGCGCKCPHSLPGQKDVSWEQPLNNQGLCHGVCKCRSNTLVTTLFSGVLRIMVENEQWRIKHHGYLGVLKVGRGGVRVSLHLGICPAIAIHYCSFWVL